MTRQTELPATPALPVLFRKITTSRSKIDLVAYCDLHDLIALVGLEAVDVIVYRINGQIAYTIDRPASGAHVSALSFKPDGSALGVGWSDGTCGVHSGEDGRLVSQFSLRRKDIGGNWKLDLTPNFDLDDEDEDAAPAAVTCLTWGAHRKFLHEDVPLETASTKASRETTTEDWFDSVEDGVAEGDDFPPQRIQDGIVELVDSVTKLDITKVIPRLSAIPSHGVRQGPEGSKFSTQANTDSTFGTQSNSKKSDIVDVLVVSCTIGIARILLDDIVKISDVDMHWQPVMHASHPRCACQVILSQTASNSEYRLHHLDLPLDTLSGPLLHVIATNTKRTQNLLSYITQTVRCIAHDYTVGTQFPTKLMNNVNEELSGKEEGDLATNLYHLAITGHFTPTVLEWLTDIMKDTNLKRWDQAISAMYTNIQNHIFINLIPALDRLSIATTTLRGHARFHEDTGRFEVAPELFTKILDGVDALRLIANKTLRIVASEFPRFRAFSKWMRAMIEVGVAGPGSKSARETEEREVPNLDYELLLEYMEESLSESRLKLHVQSLESNNGICSKDEFFSHPTNIQISYDNTCKIYEKFDEHGVPEDSSPSLNLTAITVCLAGHARLAVEAITAWQSKMLPPHLPNHPLQFIGKEANILDLRQHRHPKSSADSLTQLLVYDEVESTGKTLHSYELTRDAKLNKHTFGESSFHVPSEILQAKLLSKQQCLLLTQEDDGTRTLAHADFEAHAIDSDIWLTSLHIFPHGTGFLPGSFVVGGRKGRMVCVVFESSGTEWRVLDLESTAATTNHVATGVTLQAESDDEEMLG